MWRPQGGSPETSTIYMFRRTEIEERILGAGFHVEAKRRLTRDLYMFRRTDIEVQILSAGFHVEAKRRLTRDL